MFKKIIRLGLTLCIIGFATTLLLAWANDVTKDIISENTEKNEINSRKTLVTADEFTEIGNDVYEGKTDNVTVGYCVNITSKGYGGDIKMIVGFNEDLTVTGIKIIESSETAGLGANASKPEFSQKLYGKMPPLTASKGGGEADNEFDAISGATITSNAVAAGINAAYEKAKGAIK